MSGTAKAFTTVAGAGDPVALVEVDGTLSAIGEAKLIQGLAILQAMSFNNAERGGWHVGRPFPETIALFHSEITEAFEEWRDGHPVGEIYYRHPQTKETKDSEGLPLEQWRAESDGFGDTDMYRNKVEGVAAEFADVLIRIFDVAEEFEIPVIEALVQKHAFNLTRPARHGGKLA